MRRWDRGAVLARLTLPAFWPLSILAALSLAPVHGGADGLDAARVAANWVGVVETDKPRREGGELEIDVVRADGSLVEVTIGDRMELLGFDEEVGPGGGRAADEVTGSLRARAVRAALAVVAGGRAVGVERERDGELEVAISALERSPRGGRPRPAAARSRGRIREPGRRVNDPAYRRGSASTSSTLPAG